MPKALSTATVLFALSILPASAQNARSFVSGQGSDAAVCTLAAPCRTLAHAFSLTNAGGEINILDTAGYGSLTIDKAISIVNDGVGTAGVIVPSGGSGITINAGVNDAISLRGLSIEGGGTGVNGIVLNSAASLTIINCYSRRSANGILLQPSTAAKIIIRETVVSDNSNGIYLKPLSSSVKPKLVVERSTITGNSNQGFLMQTNGNATLVSSNISENAQSGAYVDAGLLFIKDSVLNYNDHGLTVNGGNAMLTRTTIVQNIHEGVVEVGTVFSYGDNTINLNGVMDTTANLTSATFK